MQNPFSYKQKSKSIIFLTALIFAAAILYASVGHAGASGYLAAMALFGLAPLEMKPAALVLHILVASIAVSKYLKAGRFSWPIFWPFALSSIPFAYLGGLIRLPDIYYKPIIGLFLLYAAYHFVKDAGKPDYTMGYCGGYWRLYWCRIWQQTAAGLSAFAGWGKNASNQLEIPMAAYAAFV